MSTPKLTRIQRKRIIRAEVLALHGYQCFYCDLLLAEEDVTLDHVVPRSVGGSDTAENQVPACETCNHMKASRHIEEFRALVFARGRVQLGQAIAKAVQDNCWSPWERVLLALMRLLAQRAVNQRFPGELRSSPGLSRHVAARRDFAHA